MTLTGMGYVVFFSPTRMVHIGCIIPVSCKCAGSHCYHHSMPPMLLETTRENACCVGKCILFCKIGNK